MGSVEQALKDLKLEKYIGAFDVAGYDDLEEIREMHGDKKSEYDEMIDTINETLKKGNYECNSMKRAHVRKLRNWILNESKTTTTTTTTTTTKTTKTTTTTTTTTTKTTTTTGTDEFSNLDPDDRDLIETLAETNTSVKEIAKKLHQTDVTIQNYLDSLKQKKIG